MSSSPRLRNECFWPALIWLDSVRRHGLRFSSPSSFAAHAGLTVPRASLTLLPCSLEHHAAIEPDHACVQSLRGGGFCRCAGTLSQQRLDRRPARRAADRERGCGVPRVGLMPPGPTHRCRARARAADHGGETRNQRGDGRVPADAFPVVATAWQAMLRPDFLLHGVTSRTGGCAVLVIINGPIRQEIGANRLVQRARQQRSRDRCHRAGHATRPDQYARSPARRNRPLDTGPSREIHVLRRRG